MAALADCKAIFQPCSPAKGLKTPQKESSCSQEAQWGRGVLQKVREAKEDCRYIYVGSAKLQKDMGFDTLRSAEGKPEKDRLVYLSCIHEDEKGRVTSTKLEPGDHVYRKIVGNEKYGRYVKAATGQPMFHHAIFGGFDEATGRPFFIEFFAGQAGHPPCQACQVKPNKEGQSGYLARSCVKHFSSWQRVELFQYGVPDEEKKLRPSGTCTTQPKLCQTRIVGNAQEAFQLGLSKEYHLLHYNCEHFAMSCTMGYPPTMQGQAAENSRLVAAKAAAGITVVGVVVVGLAATYGVHYVYQKVKNKVKVKYGKEEHERQMQAIQGGQ